MVLGQVDAPLQQQTTVFTFETKTEFGTKFREMVATEGVPAALRWRAAQFKE